MYNDQRGGPKMQTAATMPSTNDSSLDDGDDEDVSSLPALVSSTPSFEDAVPPPSPRRLLAPVALVSSISLIFFFFFFFMLSLNASASFSSFVWLPRPMYFFCGVYPFGSFATVKRPSDISPIPLGCASRKTSSKHPNTGSRSMFSNCCGVISAWPGIPSAFSSRQNNVTFSCDSIDRRARARVPPRFWEITSKKTRGEKGTA
mmetsp:Transcript_16527/g.23160  ORF Transcript_16527/g.23160 Transcript_16527/m.23160 type:complete len:203 (-) Transcript_16527:665-1273(-)